MSGDLDVTGYDYRDACWPTSATIGDIANALVYNANGNISRYDAAGL